MSFSLKHVEKKTVFALYLQGKTLMGEDQYVYLGIPAPKIKALQKELETKNTDVTKWGVVLAHGIGFPSHDLKTKMHEKYELGEQGGLDYKAQIKQAAEAYNN